MRRRMIDPEIWDSALAKDWKANDFLVMVAAISAADDEGRGRLSMIYRNISSMISQKMFNKSLKKLSDAIIIYEKIYFFLPNFKNYQTINRPKASKFPKPSNIKNNNLDVKSSQQNHDTITTESLLSESEVKLSKVNLKEVKVKDPTFLKFSSSLKKLFEDHTKIKDPNKSTHLNPILQFYEKIPEVMTEVDVSNCIQSAFKSLDPGKGVRIDFLCEGIQQRITAEHERILTEAKVAEHEEARKDRAEQNKADSKKNAEECKEQQKKCIEFWGENRKKFKTEENLEIKRHVTSGNYYAAAKLINSKMDEFELI